MIGNTGVMGVVRTRGWLGGEGLGGEIHGPKHHPGGGEVVAAGVDDSHDFGAVQGYVAPVHGHAETREGGEAAGTGDVVEAGPGIEVMAAAGACPNRCAPAMATAGKNVTADTDNQLLRAHRDLRRVI